nr:reverse transcriptase domain-containing protein [Tanacetum cinerariifolium]
MTIHLLINSQEDDQGKIKVAVEEVFEFKEVPENKRVTLIATKLHGRASAWWQQLKLTMERVGKPRIMSWQKMKKCMRDNFIPRNYQRQMYQRSGLKCFNCGKPGYRQSECKKAGKRHLYTDPEGDDDAAYEEYEEAPVYNEEPECKEEYISRDVRVNFVFPT